jgi:hypothetical protein
VAGDHHSEEPNADQKVGTEDDSTPASRRGKPTWLITTVITSCVVAGLGIGFSIVDHSGGAVGLSPLDTGSEAIYSASLISITPVGPSELSVETAITNGGTVAGTPLCVWTFGSSNGSYHGTLLAGTPDPIQPGKSITVTSNAVVTEQGAAYIDIANSSVSCS